MKLKGTVGIGPNIQSGPCPIGPVTHPREPKCGDTPTWAVTCGSMGFTHMQAHVSTCGYKYPQLPPCKVLTPLRFSFCNYSLGASLSRILSIANLSVRVFSLRKHPQEFQVLKQLKVSTVLDREVAQTFGAVCGNLNKKSCDLTSSS
ncbi:hypothetical protein SLE2022_258230 [Rubroshorea leprosula]